MRVYFDMKMDQGKEGKRGEEIAALVYLLLRLPPDLAPDLPLGHPPAFPWPRPPLLPDLPLFFPMCFTSLSGAGRLGIVFVPR